jgi:hypothetical protein
MAFVRLAPAKELHYATGVASGVFPPHPLSVVPIAVQILLNARMIGKKTWVRLAIAVALSLFLTACKDTKTLQLNEQLKAFVVELQ